MQPQLTTHHLHSCSIECTRPAAHHDRYKLVEELTEREIEVMREFLNPGASKLLVAGKLIMSMHTLNSHLRNIYGKLGENDIRGAVWRFVQCYPTYLGEHLTYYVLPHSLN